MPGQRHLLIVIASILAAHGMACSDDDTPQGVAPPAVGSGGAGGAGGGGDGGTVADRFAPLVAAIESEMVSLGAPGAAVAVVEGGEVTFARGFGRKHPEQDDPVAATTLFRIASVTKMLTATGLLQQVEAGNVNLAEPITTYLPGFDFTQDATWAPSITIEHLLTHQSAMADHIGLEVPASQQTDAALSEYLTGAFTLSGYLMAPAGRMYNYSNPNFMFAGLVAETTAGQYYREYLDERVFTPLGMDRTFFLPAAVIADGDYAYGDGVDWNTGNPKIHAPDGYDNGWGRPAGFAFSSVLDLAQFLLFLRDGDPTVLSDTLRTAMQQPQVDQQVVLDLVHYGYGLVIDNGFMAGSGDYYEMKRVRHNGAIPGFAAELHFFPALDFGFIALANTDGAYFQQSLSVALQTLCALPTPDTAPDLTEDLDNYDHYAGEYLDPYTLGTIHVVRDGSTLRANIPAFGASHSAVLTPFSPRNFYINLWDMDFLITFILDAQGEGEYLRGRYFVGERVTAPAAAGQRAFTEAQRQSRREQLARQLRHRPVGPSRWPRARASH